MNSAFIREEERKHGVRYTGAGKNIMSTNSGKISGYDIRTEKGMSGMLKTLAAGYPGYDGSPFSIRLLDARRCSIGLYLIEEHEIQLSSVSRIEDLTLMECAVHELAHHIDTCINNGKCSFHSRKFYRIYFNLYARAEELGFLKYDDVSNDRCYVYETGKDGRPYDIQIMEHYYGRPDGKPVDRDLLKRELEERRAARNAKAIQTAKEKEQAEKAYKDELETKRRLKAQEERERIFQETFGWI